MEIPPAFAVAVGADLEVEEHLVRMRDGVRLATDVYLPPAVRGQRLPAVLVRLPYGKRGPISFMPPVATHLAERGYGVVVQDVRGKGASEGERDPFVHEVVDGFDTLEWLTAQTWSDGAVGMVGDSYYGYTQWAAAASGHTGLRAIVPRVTSTRVADDWMHHGGVFCLGPMVDWCGGTWTGPEPDEAPRDWSRRPMAALADPRWGGGAPGRRHTVLDVWRTQGPQSAYWTRGDLASVSPDRLRVPALHLGGFWDIFRRGQVRDWSASARRSDQRLMIAATDHLWNHLPTTPGRGTNPMASAEAFEAFLPRYLDDAVGFLDEHLRSRSTTPRGASVRYELAGVGWRQATAWPPEGVRELNLFPADAANAPAGPEGGALARRPDPGHGSVAWVHDPADLVPTNEDVWGPLLALPDERDVEVRPDVVTFSTDPLPRDLDVVGDQHALLVVSAEAGPTAVVAKLVHVVPDGTARRITEGAAALDVDVALGPQLVSVDLGPTAYRIPRGHRLRLDVSASHFPRYLPALAPGTDPWTAEPGRPWKHRLHLGSETRLVLQTIERTGERT